MVIEVGYRIASLALVALLLAMGTASADSDLMLPYPTVYGKIPASTFDARRHRVGDANLEIERREDGTVQIYAESGVDGGERTVATATLAPIEGTDRLRPILQTAHTFDANDRSLGVMEIDHGAGHATCSLPTASGEGMKTQSLALPEHDRVANVPLSLLFDPLVKGRAAKVEFQIVLCRSDAKLMDFQARVVRRDAGDGASENLVEVRYGPDFGSIFSGVAQAIVPRLSFWFDPDSPAQWIAHRMPLYTDGPEVFVVRQGVETSSLVD